MSKKLIINADDFNLTAGVSRGILECVDAGIVTSTSIMINCEMDENLFSELRNRENLGMGLHLNITYGNPVSQVYDIPTLIDEKENFHKNRKSWDDVMGSEVLIEYESQIRAFEAIFEKKPTHLDTHHHIHDNPSICWVLKDISRRFSIPIRKCSQEYDELIKTTDYFFGDVGADIYWSKEKLIQTLKELPEGTSELICHPGHVDAELKKVSSMLEARTNDLEIFSSDEIKSEIEKNEIELIHFGDL